MRREKSEVVLPPLCTLAAYTTKKIFISLDGSWVERELPLFTPKKGDHLFPPEISPFYPPKGGAPGEKGQFPFYTASRETGVKWDKFFKEFSICILLYKIKRIFHFLHKYNRKFFPLFIYFFRIHLCQPCNQLQFF